MKIINIIKNCQTTLCKILGMFWCSVYTNLLPYPPTLTPTPTPPHVTILYATLSFSSTSSSLTLPSLAFHIYLSVSVPVFIDPIYIFSACMPGCCISSFWQFSMFLFAAYQLALSINQWLNSLRQRWNKIIFTVDIFKCILLNVNVWISIEF